MANPQDESEEPQGNGALPLIAGSYMEPGDAAHYWRHYDDRFHRVRLAAERGDDRILANNARLAEFVESPIPLDTLPAWSFFPPAMCGDISARVVEAVMTGGRSFCLTDQALDDLGLPRRGYIDLERLGWGRGKVEARIEVKGAGTEWTRTHLDPEKVAPVLAAYPSLAASWAAACEGGVTPFLMSSLETYLGRNIGGQSETCGHNAVRTSEDLLLTSDVKFLPTWRSIAYSPALHRHLGLISRAASASESLYLGIVVNELRFSPGSVRAVYFDGATTDEELVHLAERVSRDDHELEECGIQMVEDVPRYLALLAAHTKASPCGVACTWTKIGDIHELFDPGADRSYPDVHDYKEVKRAAWFLAKDEVVVRRVGKFFTDMEGCAVQPRGFLSLLGQEMRRHHELVVINVLRDHSRVITQFEIARSLRGGAHVGQSVRRGIERSVLARLASAANRTRDVAIALGERRVEVTITYPGLGGTRVCYDLPRQWLGERYA